MDENYLLTNAPARRIFPEIAPLPIVDAHNHANVREIFENENYADIWQVEAATDHYVWELLRKRGVEERYITGDASNREKWDALARVFPEFGGNPTYEWVHLDLCRRLDVDALINAQNAGTIWDQSRRVLQEPTKKPQALLAEMQVEALCSTDDPVDRLEYHEKLADVTGTARVLPTWRPDKAMNIFKPEFPRYLQALGDRVGEEITDLPGLVAALQQTHDYFAKHGCVATDHGVETPYGYSVDEARADAVLAKRLKGDALSQNETRDYMSYILQTFAEMNANAGWVMQLHIGAVRDVRDKLHEELGPDTGGDVSTHLIWILRPLRDLLNRFDGRLKLVLYSLDPHHAATLATITRAFGQDVNLGAAWWFNDSPVGMKRQLEYIASVDLLANFAGFVTDSRKLMSYGSRTEMFRRVLADVLGTMVDKGQVPEEVAVEIGRHVCYEGPKQFFGF